MTSRIPIYQTATSATSSTVNIIQRRITLVVYTVVTASPTCWRVPCMLAISWCLRSLPWSPTLLWRGSTGTTTSKFRANTAEPSSEIQTGALVQLFGTARGAATALAITERAPTPTCANVTNSSTDSYALNAIHKCTPKPNVPGRANACGTVVNARRFVNATKRVRDTARVRILAHAHVMPDITVRRANTLVSTSASTASAARSDANVDLDGSATSAIPRVP